MSLRYCKDAGRCRAAVDVFIARFPASVVGGKVVPLLDLFWGTVVHYLPKPTTGLEYTFRSD